DLAAIRRRHDGVESLVIESDLRAELRALLGRVSDLERLATRVELAIAHPRDLGSIRDSLIAAAEIEAQIRARSSRSTDDALTRLAPGSIADDVLGMLETALVPDPPTTHTAGGIFADAV